jgi:hypothetical protein
VADYFYQCTSETQVRAFDFPPADFSHLIHKITSGEAIQMDIEIPSNFFSAEALTLRRVSSQQHLAPAPAPQLPATSTATTRGANNCDGPNRPAQQHTNPNSDGDISQVIALYVHSHPGSHVTVHMICQAADMTRTTLVDQCNLNEVHDCLNFAILGSCCRHNCPRSHAKTAQWPRSIKQTVLEQLPSIRPPTRGSPSPSPSRT